MSVKTYTYLFLLAVCLLTRASLKLITFINTDALYAESVAVSRGFSVLLLSYPLCYLHILLHPVHLWAGYAQPKMHHTRFDMIRLAPV